jgi:L-idonate 5-dehydrogenase
MKAVVIHAAGDLRIDDVDPQVLKPTDVKVRIQAGGICGSDLHYYRHGGFGVVRLKQPMILGHEIAGAVVEVGSNVTRVSVGQRVAVNPSQPCGRCRFCAQGLQNHCLDMLFYGSAMRFPHVSGAFREELVCDQAQAVPTPEGLSVAEAAFAEPLAVCLHAVQQAGSVLGRRVLVSGSGPIGVLIAAVAHAAGAAEIVVTDVEDAPLRFAQMVGARKTLNVAKKPQEFSTYKEDKGYFDVMFEASGAGAAVLEGIEAVAPRGVLVQVGQGAEATLPMSRIVAKELQLRGAFRFHREFAEAVEFLAQRRIDVRPLLTATIQMKDAREAFDLAGDKSRSLKVQLAF